MVYPFVWSSSGKAVPDELSLIVAEIPTLPKPELSTL